MPKPSAAPSESRQKFEKQVEELCTTLEELRPGTGAGIQVLLTMAYEQAERDTREQCAQRWIPVEEKLPEPDIWVIGLHEHDGKQHVTPAYGKMTGTPRRTFHFQSEFPVTHWMPLPDPPVTERVRGKGAQ